MLLILAVLGFLATPSWAQVDCSNKEDGNYGIGCYSYTNCSGGVGTTIECPGGEVYDTNATPNACNDIASVTTPCAFTTDCSSVSGDVRFAVPGACSHFYRCTNGAFQGVHPCANPSNPLLVFDEDTQVCNWSFFTAAPCGTASPT